MPIEVITALIALVGIMISMLVSYITSQRQIKLELRRFREDAHKVFGSKLYDKRLEVYPELYRYISDFIKLIYYGAINNVAVTELFNHFQEWDSTNAIYFTAHTHEICRQVRHHFGALSMHSDEELKREFSSDDAKAALKEELQKVESALKYELGILAFESPLVVKEKVPYDSYEHERKQRHREDAAGGAGN